MQKKPVGMYSGNDRYEGFIVDMLDRLSDMMQFKYQLTLVKDKRYGFRRADGTWDGMIGELVRDVGFFVYIQSLASFLSTSNLLENPCIPSSVSVKLFNPPSAK